MKQALRWLAVLPGALVTGLLATVPLHLVLYQTLRHFIEPYPRLPEEVLTPFVVAACFVWAGGRIAPTRQVETAVALFGLWILGLGGAIALILFDVNVHGYRLYLSTGALAPVLAFVGGVVGVLIVRQQAIASGGASTGEGGPTEAM